MCSHSTSFQATCNKPYGEQQVVASFLCQCKIALVFYFVAISCNLVSQVLGSSDTYYSSQRASVESGYVTVFQIETCKPMYPSVNRKASFLAKKCKYSIRDCAPFGLEIKVGKH